ncbi:MAG TPA: MerR family transcriptional regulator [Thermomicrobiales bacterium]|nr:MerR family transcriptional regulator [Thermomicrobiales bacterium]
MTEHDPTGFPAVEATASRAWTISEVARMAHVTTRTLRHYDRVGLLPPAGVRENGYRVYRRPQLLRLQRILLLREFGMDLETIATILDGERDELAALEVHRAWLLAERDRMQALAETVGRTIADLKGEASMPEEQLFEGFENPYEDEARQRWGDEAVDRSNTAWAELGADGQKAHIAESEAIERDLAALMQAGVPVEDARVQAVIERHFRWMSRFWTPNAESYACIGQMYVDDPRFTAHYDGADGARAGLAAYLRDAMALYARESLTA